MAETPRPKRNPLLPAFVGALLLAYFDIKFYFIEHHYIALGSAIVIPIAIFIILFLSRLRFAWYAALFVVLMIAVTLFLTYQLGYMGFPLTSFLAVVDLLLFALFLTLLWKAREPYLRYVAPQRDLTKRWSEWPPAVRSRFPSRPHVRCGPRSFSVAIAHLVLVR